MKKTLTAMLGCLGLLGLAATSAAQAPARQAKVIEVQGDASTADHQPLQADEVLPLGTGIALGANSSLRLADPCGAIVLIAGPQQGKLGALIGVESAPTGCKEAGDEDAKARQQLALLFLDQSPTRVLRGARTVSAVWDLDVAYPGAACVASGAVPIFAGDREVLGDSVEVADLVTGASGLSFFDETRGGWPWPEEIAIHAGEYRVASKLQSSSFKIAIIGDPPREPTPLARRLLAAGCATQALRLLPLLPADHRIAGPG